MTRTRLERVRAAVGIASLALQQIEDDVRADDVGQEELAGILRGLIEDTDPPGGFIPVVARLPGASGLPALASPRTQGPADHGPPAAAQLRAAAPRAVQPPTPPPRTTKARTEAR